MTKRHKRMKAPSHAFRGAFAVLWFASIVFALYGATGWLVSLWATSVPLAILMAGAFATAPLVAAALTGPALRGGGIAAWSAVLVFCAMDAAGNAQAFWAFESVAMGAKNSASEEAHKAALARFEADRKAASDLLAASNAALLALPSATEACKGHGPQNCKARLEGLTADTQRLEATASAAQASLQALRAPSSPEVSRLLPWEVSGSLHALLSFALVLAFVGVHAARRKAEGVKVERAAKPRGRKARPRAKATAPVVRLAARNGEQLSLF